MPPSSTTTQEMHLLFVDSGLDAVWAIYVLLAVIGSAFIFLKAFHYGNDFFQEDNLRI